jgi:hypothetical protein
MLEEMDNDWQGCNSQVFWGEIAPCDHLCQIYDNDEVMLNSLEGFIFSGLEQGESIIIIATASHLNALEDRIKVHGYDIGILTASDQYIPLNAEQALAKFMVNGWPDEKLFPKMVKELTMRARGKTGRKVRAYGEMVAILWAQGYNGATVQLEHMWNRFCETDALCLFCAYPRIGFTQDMNSSVMEICKAHSKIISGETMPKTEIYYREMA